MQHANSSILFFNIDPWRRFLLPRNLPGLVGHGPRPPRLLQPHLPYGRLPLARDCQGPLAADPLFPGAL